MYIFHIFAIFGGDLCVKVVVKCQLNTVMYSLCLGPQTFILILFCLTLPVFSTGVFVAIVIHHWLESHLSLIISVYVYPQLASVMLLPESYLIVCWIISVCFFSIK